MPLVDYAQRLYLADDVAIADHRWLSRKLGDVRKLGQPMLRPERPWEATVVHYCSVHHDSARQRYRMWYRTSTAAICYAESADGYAWERPALDLHPWQGQLPTNIVVAPSRANDLGGVFLDPLETNPDRRFKMILFRGIPGGTEHDGRSTGIYGYTSADGLRWQLSARPITPAHAGDRCSVLVDEPNRRYLIYSRNLQTDAQRRQVHIWASSDFATSEYLGPAVVTDLDDDLETQFYGLMPFAWNGHYFGFLELMRAEPDSLGDVGRQRLHCELAFSRDGLRWTRVCRGQPFLPHGPDGSWDAAWAVPGCNPLVQVRNRLVGWYMGATDHGTLMYGGIGMFSLAVDRFVGLQAGAFEGILQLRPGTWRGGQMAITGLHFAPGGRLAYEVLDEHGQVVPGYARDDCHVIVEDGPASDGILRFDNGSLHDLAGRVIAFRLYLRQGTLYSLEAQSR